MSVSATENLTCVLNDVSQSDCKGADAFASRAFRCAYACRMHQDVTWRSCSSVHGRGVAEVLSRVRHESPQLMVASHNQQSVEFAVEGMHARHLPTSAGAHALHVYHLYNASFSLAGQSADRPSQQL